MLILSRRLQESITIMHQDTAINIKFLKMQHGQISLGFSADPEVIIMRDEIIGKPKKDKTNGAN